MSLKRGVASIEWWVVPQMPADAWLEQSLESAAEQLFTALCTAEMLIRRDALELLVYGLDAKPLLAAAMAQGFCQ
jgi:hypothetical protein